MAKFNRDNKVNRKPSAKVERFESPKVDRFESPKVEKFESPKVNRTPSAKVGKPSTAPSNPLPNAPKQIGYKPVGSGMHTSGIDPSKVAIEMGGPPDPSGIKVTKGEWGTKVAPEAKSPLPKAPKTKAMYGHEKLWNEAELAEKASKGSNVAKTATKVGRLARVGNALNTANLVTAIPTIAYESRQAGEAKQDEILRQHDPLKEQFMASGYGNPDKLDPYRQAMIDKYNGGNNNTLDDMIMRNQVMGISNSATRALRGDRDETFDPQGNVVSSTPLTPIGERPDTMGKFSGHGWDRTVPMPLAEQQANIIPPETPMQQPESKPELPAEITAAIAAAPKRIPTPMYPYDPRGEEAVRGIYDDAMATSNEQMGKGSALADEMLQARLRTVGHGVGANLNIADQAVGLGNNVINRRAEHAKTNAQIAGSAMPAIEGAVQQGQIPENLSRKSELDQIEAMNNPLWPSHANYYNANADKERKATAALPDKVELAKEKTKERIMTTAMQLGPKFKEQNPELTEQESIALAYETIMHLEKGDQLIVDEGDAGVPEGFFNNLLGRTRPERKRSSQFLSKDSPLGAVGKGSKPFDFTPYK